MNTKDLHNIWLDPDFTVDLMHLFIKYGLVNEIMLRNAIIIKEYNEAKKNNLSIKTFIEVAAKKYCLSEKAIESVIYGMQRSKQVFLGSNGNEDQQHLKAS